MIYFNREFRAPIYYLQGRPSFWENVVTGGPASAAAAAAASHSGKKISPILLSINIDTFNFCCLGMINQIEFSLCCGCFLAEN